MPESSSFSISTFIASFAKLGIKSVRAKKANVKKPFLPSKPLKLPFTQVAYTICNSPTARQSAVLMLV